MPKTRPCAKMVTIDGKPEDCPYPAMKRRQSCLYHWLMRQPPHVQEAYADQRREESTETRDRVPSSEWPRGERYCSGCRSFVPLFFCRGSRCRTCSSSASHASRVEATYGITAEEYDALFKLQGGRCAICGRVSRSRRLAVDHDHSKAGRGSVRGLLCKRCNHDLLGAANDNVGILRRAIAYLEHPPAETLLGVRDVTSDQPILLGQQGEDAPSRAVQGVRQGREEGPLF